MPALQPWRLKAQSASHAAPRRRCWSGTRSKGTRRHGLASVTLICPSSDREPVTHTSASSSRPREKPRPERRRRKSARGLSRMPGSALCALNPCDAAARFPGCRPFGRRAAFLCFQDPLHVVPVVQRFSHTHKHRVREFSGLLNTKELAQYIGRFQMTMKSLPTSHAEFASHLAAHLAADA